MNNNQPKNQVSGRIIRVKTVLSCRTGVVVILLKKLSREPVFKNSLLILRNLCFYGFGIVFAINRTIHIGGQH